MTKNNRFSPASEKGHFDGLVDEGRYLRQSLLYKQILPRTPSRPKTLCSLWLYSSCSSCASWLKNPCNPRLINDLLLRKITYEFISKNMQNKPNFQKAQMNVSRVSKRDYEKMDTWWSGKNKPNSNPIQTQTKPISEKAKMNVTAIITKGYENKSHFWLKAKQTQFKPKQTQFQTPHDLFTNKILAFMAAAADNKNRISIANFRKPIVNNRRRFRNERKPGQRNQSR